MKVAYGFKDMILRCHDSSNDLDPLEQTRGAIDVERSVLKEQEAGSLFKESYRLFSFYHCLRSPPVEAAMQNVNEELQTQR